MERRTKTLTLDGMPGEFTVQELTLSDQLRVRGYRMQLTGGNWGELAVSPTVDDKLAADTAHIMAVLSVAITKYPDGVTSCDDVAAKNPLLLRQLYGKYVETFPDPFRAFYPKSDGSGEAKTEAPALLDDKGVPGKVSAPTA